MLLVSSSPVPDAGHEEALRLHQVHREVGFQHQVGSKACDCLAAALLNLGDCSSAAEAQQVLLASSSPVPDAGHEEALRLHQVHREVGFQHQVGSKACDCLAAALLDLGDCSSAAEAQQVLLASSSPVPDAGREEALRLHQVHGEVGFQHEVGCKAGDRLAAAYETRHQRGRHPALGFRIPGPSQLHEL